MADLKELGKDTLYKIGRILLAHRYYLNDKGEKRSRYKGIHIEGHADIRQISTPQYPSNWELSTARAIAVLKYFLEQFDDFKKEPELLSAAGYGEHHPVPGYSMLDYDINRRIELVLEYNVGEE
jgi:flagellar motor protein MotB